MAFRISAEREEEVKKKKTFGDHIADISKKVGKVIYCDSKNYWKKG